ncbi:MAG: RNA polymerase sigma factor [Planctomycetota bacterium]
MDKESIYNQLLVIRCRQGNQEAWGELVSRWEKPLLYYIRRMIDNEHQAWQILQETWLHVVKSIDTLKRPEYLPKWLYSICHHKIVTYYRQRHREAELCESIANGSEISETECDRQFENAESVHWGLGQIKPVSREVLTLFFLQDLSIDEIAEVLSVPAGTVKSRLYYARQQLRKVLEDQNHE